MKKFFYNIIIVSIIIILMFQHNISIAATKTELNNEKNNIDSQIQEKEDQIDEIQAQKSETLKQAEELTVEISEYELQVAELDNKINDLNTQISQAEKDITQKQAEYDSQQNLLNERLVTMYQNGNTSYLEFLLTSKSITDFISKYYMVSELATYDTELLEQIENKKNEIEEIKNSLEANKAELNETKTSKQSVLSNLKTAKLQKDSYVEQLTEEERQTQEQLELFEEDKRKITEELRQIAAEEEAQRKKAEEEAKKKEQEQSNKNKGNSNNASSNNDTTSNNNSSSNGGNSATSGYIFPVSGCSKSNIRVKTYPSYRGHTGVDININVVGKKVVAVKDGTVIKSEAKKIGGKYYSYGEVVTISHGDGTQTLYGHMLENSRTVQKGDKVKQGQVIGIVGSTGNSTGPHLHFEVRIGGDPVNPLPYLP